jgi:hypothetical protein
MIDAVLTWHTDPATCGVAKFNQQLAERLNVPLASFFDFKRFRHPLYSIKCGELGQFETWYLPPVRQCSVFLHDVPPAGSEWITKPVTMYAANPVIARAVRDRRPDVIEGFCPSTIRGNPQRANLNVLTFGMAHKLQLSHYRKLKTLLDASGQDYTVSLSTAVHEGSPWDAVADAGKELRLIFGDTLRELGYLADDALAKELRDCSAVALFFDPALRANNTSFWASWDAGKLVITNLDEDSPAMRVRPWDINELPEWPSEVAGRLKHAAMNLVEHHGDYTWDALLSLMGVGVQV